MPVQYDVPCDLRFAANTPEGVIEGELSAGVHDAEALTDDERTYLDVIAVPAGIASVVDDAPAPPSGKPDPQESKK